MGNICKRLFSPNKSGPKERKVIPNHTLPDHVHYRHKSHPNREYPSNRVKTTKYTILTFLPKNLFEQFHRYANIYFIFVALLNWIPGVSAFAKEISMVPIFFVLAVTAVKDAFEDFRRYQSDKRVNVASCRRYCRKSSRYVQSKWSELRVGDFVHLSCNEIIPADILLLKSSDSSELCHIETSNIDGETNLKQRFAVSDSTLGYAADNFSPEKFTKTIECELPSADIYKFHGNILNDDCTKIPVNQNNLLLRGCVIRNTDFVEGIVIYAGPETKAMLNNKGPRYKRSKLERRMNRDLVYCVVVLLFLCFFCAIGSGIWVGQYEDVSLVPFIPQQDFTDYSPLFQGFIVFWTYIIIFQAVIPLPLYVSLEVIKLVQVYFIQNDKELYYEPTNKRVECRALNITEDLGQVQYLFSDKTGTLTENQMDFKSCTIGGVDFPHGCDAEESSNEMRTSRFSMSSMLSRSSLDLLNLKLEPVLQRDISSMCLNSLEAHDVSVSPQTRRIQDFFLLMAICNTVVVSPHKHQDELDAQGNVIAEQEEVTEKVLSEKLATGNGFKPKAFENWAFYREDDEFGRAATPSEGSVRSMSILSEGSAPGRYDAESPDERALVIAASTYGCRLLRRMQQTVTVVLPSEGVVDYDVLHVLQFDSVRKRMSVIIRCPFSREIILYTKGADSSITSLLRKSYKENEEEKRIMEATIEHLDNYAKKGLRTLCMAKKVLDPSDYAKWKREHVVAENSMEDRDRKVFESCCRIETDLELLGATGIEDKLQEGVPETIATLRNAGIKVWVLTGDKLETAIQIAYASKLISTDELVITITARNQETCHDLLEYHIQDIGLDQDTTSTEKKKWYQWGKESPKKQKDLKKRVSLIIDGRSLSHALHNENEKLFVKLAMNCSSVVCCRSTPIQKAEVVKLVKDELKQLTLAIGDGANDVSMIQTADVGVGISGQEGMQAVMASDFAIARFKFLQRLLLVHGHWCYNRLARFALYMFYKNPLPNFTIFWFQIFSGFTGSITMDAYYLLLLHVLFTAVPPAVNGVLDKNVSAKTLLLRHDLYKNGQEGKSYTTLLFWVYMGEAFYQSFILHFIPNLAYSGSDIGLWEMGTTITVSLILTMLLFLGIETLSWTWIHWVILTFSFLLFWVFAIVLSAVCLTCDPPSNPYWVMQNTVTSPTHWLLVCLTCTVALLPRFVIRSFQTNLFPNAILQARLDERRGLVQRQKSTKKSSQRRASIDLPTSSPSMFENQNKSVNGQRPTTTSSVDVQVETLPKRSTRHSSKGQRVGHIESKKL